MSATQGVGDADPGQWLPFWQEACRIGRTRACAYLSQLEATLCRAGSGWSCNELGIRRGEVEGDAIGALASWQRGCDLKFDPACANAAVGLDDGALKTAPPTLEDYPILLRGSKRPLTDRRPAALFARACELGWNHACRRKSDP